MCENFTEFFLNIIDEHLFGIPSYKNLLSVVFSLFLDEVMRGDIKLVLVEPNC